MKYYKKYFDFIHVTKEDLNSPSIEITRSEFHELCEDPESYFMSHFVENGELCHLICISNLRLK